MTDAKTVRDKHPGTVVFTWVGAVADVAGVAALFTAPRFGLLTALGVGAVVAGLIAGIFALRGGRTVAAICAAVVLIIGGALLGYAFANRSDDSPAAAPGTAPPGVLPSSAAEPSATAVDPSSTDPSSTDPTSVVPSQDDPAAGGSWYSLTGYESVAHGNGHDSVTSIRIGTGTADYPDSIKGYYASSAAKPDNFRTWSIGGNCTKLSVWVGKDVASSKSAGTGRFIVRSGDTEIATAQATIADAPKDLEVNLTGVSRLTLLDTRSRLDANNAWGTPRVFCTAPPGNAK